MPPLDARPALTVYSDLFPDWGCIAVIFVAAGNADIAPHQNDLIPAVARAHGPSWSHAFVTTNVLFVSPNDPREAIRQPDLSRLRQNLITELTSAGFVVTMARPSDLSTEHPVPTTVRSTWD